MTEKEVDTVVAFLKEKKKEGHFRAMWKAYGELVNLMASRRSGSPTPGGRWWSRSPARASRCTTPSPRKATAPGATATASPPTAKNLDACYEWLNYWMEGYPGARQSEIGYFSTVNNYEKYLDPKLVKEVYGGEGRDGGSLADRAERVFVWNTRPKNLEYYTEKWNEFLAA